MSGTSEPMPLRTDTEVFRLVMAAREQGRPDTYVGKRHWVRYALGMRLEATDDPDKPGNTWLVRSHNISGGGLGFWSNQEAVKGTTLFLREWSEETGGGPWVAGRVTYCTLGIGGYLVGVAFGTPSRPDSIHDSNGSDASAESALSDVTGRDASTPRSLQVQCALCSALAGALGMAVGNEATRFSGLPALWRIAISIFIAFVVSGMSGWLMLIREARFLKVLHMAIEELSAGTSSSTRLPQPTSRELIGLRRAVLNLGSRWRRHGDAERVQRQKLEELTRIKTNILSIVSHDLRTPLTSILLYTRMLTDDLDTLPKENQRDFLRIIGDECTRLSRLLDDLLEVQRLESGRVEWHRKRQDLSEAVRASARVFEAMARSNSIELTVECPATLPLVDADADKIAQVLSNLLSNAMKYTPSGGKVNFSAEALASEILFCVTDNGPGIPRDKWDQIFDRFSQLSSTNTREIAGVGLGLYIVREIVQRHGGRVWVDSEMGRGSAFYVSLPLEAVASNADHRSEGDPPPARVVFCDADPELAATVAQTLQQERLELCVVHSARRLLERLSQGDVDVVVTDVLLPDMTAPDLLDAFEALEDHSFKLVVHSYEDRDLALGDRQFEIFLRRPASREELVQAVRVALQRKRSPGGLTLLLVRGDEGDLEPLKQVLSSRGHACLAAVGLGAAAEMIRDYRVDLVLVDSRVLGLGWANLKAAGWTETGNLRVAVLSHEVQRVEKRLSETYGVTVVPYTPGAEEAAANAVFAASDIPCAEPQI